MPIDLLTLLAFIPAALALNLTPGADMMFCLGQGLRGGPGAALAAATGVALGGLAGAMIAGIGVAGLVEAHPGALSLIRWGGAAYLLWLAWKALGGPLGGRGDADGETAIGRTATGGALVALTNPKGAIFSLAFIPQFVDPTGPILLQFAIFGSVLGIGGIVVNGLVGSFAGSVRRVMTRSRRIDQGLRMATATIFGALAVRLALVQRT